ncbi:uncharacterized protein [Watersipora subatra]|uniref:uncharacterized protein n=1 Tax=Watersipora subatra TaxID=2589382 RepID=UPI00355B9A6E
MGRECLITLLLLVVTVENVQGGVCVPMIKNGQKFTVNHNWLEGVETGKRKILLKGDSFVLNFTTDGPLKTLFTTQFYNCEDDVVVITTAIGNNFMANIPERSIKLGPSKGPESSFSSDHPTIFKYDSINASDGKIGGIESLGKLVSMIGSKPYVSEGPKAVLQLSDAPTKWESMPAITACDSDKHAENSSIQCAIAQDDDPEAIAVLMNVEVNRGHLHVKEILPKERLFQFSVEKYDLMESYDENGELVICDAVILSSSDKIFVEPEDDDVREDEIGYLPHIPYSRVNLEYTDDVAMKPYFTYLRPGTVNQTSIDRRHFKVFEQRPGFYRLMSIMRPGHYLAIIKVHDMIVLGLSPLDESLQSWEISYDFSIDVHDLLRHRCEPLAFH